MTVAVLSKPIQANLLHTLVKYEKKTRITGAKELLNTDATSQENADIVA